jgi:hypothetical protein
MMYRKEKLRNIYYLRKWEIPPFIMNKINLIIAKRGSNIYHTMF